MSADDSASQELNVPRLTDGALTLRELAPADAGALTANCRNPGRPCAGRSPRGPTASNPRCGTSRSTSPAR